jgi:non-heme chloroperoxidase
MHLSLEQLLRLIERPRDNFLMKLLPQILIVLVTTGLSAHAESAPELSERTVDLGNDVSLRVIEAGQPASGVTLVLIPGWSTSADIWREQINRFAATYRVISFDPRSQGRSTITTTGNTPETRAQDLHTLLDDLSVLRPVLIGWSQGAEDIAAYIDQYGTGDLSGIVLVDAALSTGAEGMGARGAPQPAALFETFAIYQTHPQKYLADMMRAIVSKPQSNDAIKQLVTTALKTPPDVGVAMRIADSFGVNRTRVLKKIDCPTLIIASAKSGSLAQQQAQTKQISDARFEKVEDAAHAVFLDQPDRFNELVTSFVAKLAPKADLKVARTATTPPPLVEIDQPMIPTLEQYRTAPKIAKARHRHKRVARVRTFWDKLRYGWIGEHPQDVKKR